MKKEIAIIVFLWCQAFNCIECTTESGAWRNVVSIYNLQSLISQPYAVVFFATTDVPQDVLAKRFNNHFAEAGSYLEDFGVRTGIVNCFRWSDNHECVSKREDSNKVYFYRKGRFLTDLPLDTMFNVDAIVANILHLVLLQEVPLLQDKTEMEKIISHATGRQDIIFGRMKAVGIPEDRAFIETAFAFSQQYKFVMATVNDHFGVDDDWEEGSNSVWLLKCKEAKWKKPCSVIPYTNAITVENMVVFIKGQELPNTLELSESSQAEFLHLGLPVVYLSGAGQDVDHLRTIMYTLAPEFKGSLGFILLNRDTLTTETEALWNLYALPSCLSSCVYLKAGESLEIIREEFTVDELRQSVKSFLTLQRSYNTPEEDEEEEEYETEELYSTSQETQDDPVEAAIFKLQMKRELNISATEQLTDKSFPEFIASNSVTFVLYTVRWNAVCLSFLESFQTIGLRASELTDANFNPLARVECSNWPDVCALSNVTMYPTLKIFRGSVNIDDYHGRLDETDVLKAYMLHSTPNAVQLTSKQEFTSVYGGSYPSWAKELLSSVVIGIYPEQDIKEIELFREISIELSGSALFIECTKECATEGARVFNVHDPSVVTVKWEDPYQPFVIFTGPSTRPNLRNFVSDSARYILPQLTPASLPSLLHGSPSIVMLFHQRDAQSEGAEAELAKVAAAELFDGLPITWIDTQESSLGRGLLREYSLPLEEDRTQLLYLNRRLNIICWYPHQGQFSESLMIDWLKAALTGGGGDTCAAALRHREWTELVQGYDFLAYIKEDREAEPGHMEAMTSGRLRHPVHHREAAALQDDVKDSDQTQSDQSIPVKSHMHTEL